jgi:hypothetical protein
MLLKHSSLIPLYCPAVDAQFFVIPLYRHATKAQFSVIPLYCAAVKAKLSVTVTVHLQMQMALFPIVF